MKDNDPIEMYHVSKEAVERARKGEGPSIIEIETYRYLGHFQGDPEVYRDKNEVTLLREKDPIVRMRQILIKEYGIEEQQLIELENKAKQEVEAAYQFARESAYPEPEDALKDLFV